MKIIATCIFAAAISLASCKYKVGITNGTELKGKGITFLVPLESGASSAGTDGIQFTGETVTAETDGKTLTVNGLNYGSLSVGDIVDLRSPGRVTVNGTLRAPPKTAP